MKKLKTGALIFVLIVICTIFAFAYYKYNQTNNDATIQKTETNKEGLNVNTNNIQNTNGNVDVNEEVIGSDNEKTGLVTTTTKLVTTNNAVVTPTNTQSEQTNNGLTEKAPLQINVLDDYKVTTTNVSETEQKLTIVFGKFPASIKLVMDENIKYSINFNTDKPIQFVLYSEENYNKWLNTGMHTISKASTRSKLYCCKDMASFLVDINKGEGGTYYIVFDNSLLANPMDVPTIGNVNIRKTGVIQ